MFRAVLVMALLGGVLVSVLAQRSPCPSVFSYVVADDRIVGEVEIPGFSYGEHILKVGMSLKIQLTSSYKGNIEMLRQKDLLETITSGKSVFYRVNFPLQRPIPKITAISFDGNLICSGPPDVFDQPGQYITSINLQHTAKATLVEVPSSGYDDVIKVRPQFVRPPSRVPPTGSFDVIYSRPDVASANGPQKPARLPERVINTNAGGHRCGLARLDANALVVGGDTTERGDWPWLATVNLKKSFRYICSGSLVSENIVITAGHCMSLQRRRTRVASDVIVQLGVYDRVNYNEDGVETRNVRSVEFPRGHNASDVLFRDITVLVLAKPVVFNQFIIPVCLWSGNTDLEDIVGTSGSVVGWGRDETGNPSTPDPRLVKVPVVSNDECKLSSPEFQFIEDPNDFCAGSRDGVSAPCNGDSGAGMYFWRNGHWELRGVVSFSLKSPETLVCDLTKFVVYTDAAKFKSWILYHIDDNSPASAG